MSVWVGPVADDVDIGSVLPDGREVLAVRYGPSVRALVSNYNLRRWPDHLRKQWKERYPEDLAAFVPMSEEPIRWAQVGGRPS